MTAYASPVLLIFGFGIRLKTVGTLEIFCPRCGGDRIGERRVARRWFSLFWIPVFPCGTVGEIVQCTTCGTQFDPHVAEQPTTAALTEILGNAVRVLTAMIVRTGDSTDAGMRAAAIAEVRSVDPSYDDATLSSDVECIDLSQAMSYVAPLATDLQVAGKERLLSGLVRIAMVGGTVTDDQRRVIDLAGRGLELTPAHITGIVTSVVAARSPEGGMGPGPTSDLDRPS